MKRRLISQRSYSLNARIVSLIVVIAGIIIIYHVQEQRRFLYTTWLGVLPNFISAIILPFFLVLSNVSIRDFTKNQFLSKFVYVVGFFILYEIILWIDGRNFDVLDIIFTILGSVLGIFCSNKIQH